MPLVEHHSLPAPLNERLIVMPEACFQHDEGAEPLVPLLRFIGPVSPDPDHRRSSRDAARLLLELRLLSSTRLDSLILLTVVLADDGRLLVQLRSDELAPLDSTHARALRSRTGDAR